MVQDNSAGNSQRDMQKNICRKDDDMIFNDVGINEETLVQVEIRNIDLALMSQKRSTHRSNHLEEQKISIRVEQNDDQRFHQNEENLLSSRQNSMNTTLIKSF